MEKILLLNKENWFETLRGWINFWPEFVERISSVAKPSAYPCVMLYKLSDVEAAVIHNTSVSLEYVYLSDFPESQEIDYERTEETEFVLRQEYENR